MSNRGGLNDGETAGYNEVSLSKIKITLHNRTEMTSLALYDTVWHGFWLYKEFKYLLWIIGYDFLKYLESGEKIETDEHNILI